MAAPLHSIENHDESALLRPFSTLLRSIWWYLKFIFRWIQVFGSFVVMISFYSPEKDKQSTNHAANEPEDEETPARFGISTMDFKRASNRAARLLFTADDVLPPLMAVTLILSSIHRALHDKDIVLADVEDFKIACPEGGRRTQASALVKLLAASITTVGIHGHLWSLTDSRSWRWQLFGAIEVLLWPLASIFALGNMAWYELATLLVKQGGPWAKSVGVKYRLARMCGVRISSPQHSSSLNRKMMPYLSTINLEHVHSTPQTHDLKWFGRVFILLVLTAQYIQAFVLLSRRFVTNTNATVDLAMLLMVFSGLSALAKSLLISILNTAWTIDRSTSPCTAKACQRAACVSLKKESDLPNKGYETVILGFNVTGIPRVILNQLVAAHLQLDMVDLTSKRFWVTYTVIGLYGIWILPIRGAITAEVIKNLPFVSPGKDVAAGNETAAPDAASGVLPLVQKRPDAGELSEKADPTSLEERPRWTGKDAVLQGLSVLLHTIMFAHGCVIVAVCIISFLAQIFQLIFSCVYLYSDIHSQTTSWATHNSTEPCPQLWKDGLEDEVWWF